MQLKQRQTNNKLKLMKMGGVFVAIVAVAATAFVLNQKSKKTVSSAQVTTPSYSSDLPGWWLKDNFSSSVCDKDNCKADSDPDGDKLTNAQEYFYHTNPLQKDTNKNGLSDGDDVAAGYDPSKPGKVTFDTAASDDSIVGESLVFDKDIKQMFAQEISPDNIKIPQPDSSLLNIGKDDSKKAVDDYLKTSFDITQKILPANFSQYVETATTTQNQNMIDNISDISQKAVNQLSAMSVPPSAVQLHKYTISFFQLLPIVVKIPSQAEIENLKDPNSSAWYDSAQAFTILLQKIDLEQQKLSKI